MKAVAEFETDRICLVIEKGDSPILLLEDPHSKDKFAHGMISNAQHLLTIEEAEKMALSLFSAAQTLRRMQEECKQYFSEEEKSRRD